MNPLSAKLTAAAAEKPNPELARKMHDAAQQFEGLLLQQLMQAARGDGSAWGGEDGSAQTMMEYGEQAVATAISSRGGLGIGKMVEAAFSRSLSSSKTKPASPVPSGTLPLAKSV
jgi:peptidoglycan hydrolase FlgJ